MVGPRSVCVHGTLHLSGAIPNTQYGIIFGGEVDPSGKGHEGAGGFSDDIFLLTHCDNSDGIIVESVIKPEQVTWPQCRGWSDGDVYENKLFFFGGLTGDDEHPERLDDLWVCNVTVS